MPRRTTERRQHIRVPATLAMQLRDVLEDGSVLTTESMNVSVGGLYCQVKRPIEALTRLGLTLVLPPAGKRTTPRLVKCKAVVVRCEREEAPRRRNLYSVACCFTDIAAADRATIQEFVAWRSRREA